MQKTKLLPDFDSVLSQLKAGFMRDFTVEEACHSANISKMTYYRWLEECDEFAAEIEKSKDYAFRAAKKLLIDSIVDGKDINNAKWLLERRRKRMYAAGTALIGDEENPLIIKVKDYGDDDSSTGETEEGITSII